MLDDPAGGTLPLAENQLATTLLALLTLAPGPSALRDRLHAHPAPREPAAALFDTWQTAPARAGQKTESHR